MGQRKIIAFTFVLFLISSRWCSGQSDVPLLKADLLGKILPGKEAGQLGFRRMTGGGGDIEPSVPVVFRDEIFILDNQNWRINCYDLNMQFRRAIEITGSDRNIPFQSGFVFVYENGDFSTSRDVLARIGVDGKLVYEIPSVQFPRDLASQAKYWIFKDFAVFYLDNGNLGAVDKMGKILNPEEAQKLNEAMKETSSLRKESAELRDAIDQFLVKNKLVIVGDRILTDNPTDYFNFYKTIRGKMQSSKKNILDAKLPESSGLIYGFDAEDNAYWRFSIRSKQTETVIVVVVSKMGEMLGMFRIEGRGYPVILPNGDILLADVEWIKMGSPLFVYYRVKRNW